MYKGKERHTGTYSEKLAWFQLPICHAYHGHMNECSAYNGHIFVFHAYHGQIYEKSGYVSVPMGTFVQATFILSLCNCNHTFHDKDQIFLIWKLCLLQLRLITSFLFFKQKKQTGHIYHIKTIRSVY